MLHGHIIFFKADPTLDLSSPNFLTMKIFFSIFAAAVAAPVSAEIYFKEQFNDDVSFHTCFLTTLAMCWAGLVVKGNVHVEKVTDEGIR